ncbi:cell division cycle protein 20 homolog B-like [Conger conger]|uniref:cell division cycle protein 20 homolog B-like n=1 Tax=Conger conger TaxID=82655 RepID=UPI002A59C74F|nr:cell division cycle protein 20 homolog B-like [Conger conger]
MEWKLARYSRFRVKPHEVTLWENIMNKLSKDFVRTKRHYPLKTLSTKTNRKHRTPTFSYRRFRSRIARRLNDDGLPVASSPVTTGWQHSFISEYDTVCQRLRLDSPPHDASRSPSHLGDLETPSNQNREGLAHGDCSDLSSGRTQQETPANDRKEAADQGCYWKDSGGAETASCSRLQPFTVLDRAPSMHCSQPEPQLRMIIPGLQDNYYLSLMDRGGRSLVALALGSTVVLWSGETHRLQGSIHLHPHTSTCSVTSVSWSQDGCTLAIGTGDGEIQLWDVESRSKLRSVHGHLSQVGALTWNQQLISSGSLLGSIRHHDVRAGPPVGGAQLRKGVCGLEWSPSGHRLASGSTDGLLCIWPRDPGVTHRAPPISSIPHPTAVKALGWCPWQSEVLAVGGGRTDGVLRVWDTNRDTCLHSVPTNSQICSLRWSCRRKELFTAHGLPHNHINCWTFPSFTQKAQLQGHTGRVLDLALSSGEEWILSCGSDQRACLWDNRPQDTPLLPDHFPDQP